MTEGKTKNRQELTAYLADTYDTSLIDSFREQPGIFPGWHMNKAHWLSAALDGTVEDEKIKFLVDMSYELTKK